MNSVKCPHCNKQFELDETGYAHLMKEVRDEEFRKEIEQIRESLEQKYESDIVAFKAEQDKHEQEIIEDYKSQLEEKDKVIEYYSEFKIRLSTKNVGESLEQYCSDKFDEIRAVAFPKAEFEKDNDDSDGSKGDFIFRDYTEDGTELISIMFEMKNEMSTTKTKQKNSHFFKKLDEDRKKKNCEYAVLVSMLEAQSDLYNNGIVDVSHEYEKMYVIRPQFFIPIISFLRNAALKSKDYIVEIEELKKQRVELSNFEQNLMTVQDKTGKKYSKAAEYYDDAIAKVQESIDALMKTKEDLEKSREYLEDVNSITQKINITTLTKGAPEIRKELKEISKQNS